MNKQTHGRRLLVAVLALVAGLAAFTTQAEAGKKKATKANVTLKIETANQQQLLKQKKLLVKVKSTGKASPKLTWSTAARAITSRE